MPVWECRLVVAPCRQLAFSMPARSSFACTGDEPFICQWPALAPSFSGPLEPPTLIDRLSDVFWGGAAYVVVCPPHKTRSAEGRA